MGSACCNKTAKEKQGDIRPSEPASTATAAATTVATTECCTTEKEGCNEICIKNAAAIMCHSDTNGHATGFKSTQDDGPQTSLPSACGTHLQRAMDKYQTFLESALCICRDMRSQGMRTNCCGIGIDELQSGQSYLRLAGESLESARCGNTDKTPATMTEEIRGGHDEHDHAERHVEHSDKHGNHGCCDSSTPPAYISTVHNRDVEKGAAGTEPMTILVSGMTCSGCGEQLHRALMTTKGVDNVNVNFMQGRADFTFQPGLVDINSLIRKTQGATGFEITMLSTDESVDVLLTPGIRGRRAALEATKGLSQQLLSLDGISEVTPLTKTRVRIQYDPLTIGARDLTDKTIASGICSGLAPPESDKQLTAGRSRFRILLYQTIASTVLTIPVLVLAWGVDNPRLSLAVVNKHTRSIISLVLATLVQILSIPVFYAPALTALVRYRVFELDMLVVMSITAAYVYSAVAFGYAMAGRQLRTGEFFETSTLLVTLIMLGRLVASWARIKAVGAVSLRGLQVPTAVLVKSSIEEREGSGDGGGAEEVREIDAPLLQFGDYFKVLPHSRVPTDGVVVSGVSEVDEAMLTGESMPVPKRAGDIVAAGTLNGSGSLVVRLTRLPSSNTVTDIARLVEDAGSSKPRVQELADRVAGWFLPAVLGIATVVLVVWSVVGVRVQGQTAGEAVSMAVTYVVAVLAVSCPCALGLAVPMVLVIANGIAARGGVVVKSAGVTEQARKVTDIVFDKTGTLTEPDLDVVSEEYFGNDPGEMKAILLALVRDSKHPVSEAIAKHIAGGPNPAGPSPLVRSSQSIPGMGIEGELNSTVNVRAGNPSWALGLDNNKNLPVVIQDMLDDGQSILVLSLDCIPAAVIGLRTRLRHNARTIISSLQAHKITIHLVSGDQPAAVHSVAQTLGINATNVAAQQTPQQKQTYVSSLMNNSTTDKKRRVVMFCGDGTNDAPAVAQADIGVQLISDSLSASDVTRSAADVVLLSGLEGITFLLDVSRAAFARIVFNFVWSALYNVLAILLAAGAFVEVRIAPAYAGAGEMVSVLPVIAAAVSMLLLKVRGGSSST